MEDRLSPVQIQSLRAIINEFSQDLHDYLTIYYSLHQYPDLPLKAWRTAGIVSAHLTRIGLAVRIAVGGHGVVGTFNNGPGKIILLRAELDGAPIQELTNLPYKSKEESYDTAGKLRPVMHASGHDMNMTTLLAATDLLVRAKSRWSGTLIVVFQPDESGVYAPRMVDDEWFRRLPQPDYMLSQQVTPIAGACVAVSPGPVLPTADWIRVLIPGSYSYHLTDYNCHPRPISLAIQIISTLQDYVHQGVGRDQFVTVECWGFHAGPSANPSINCDDVDFFLNVQTADYRVREQALALIDSKIREDLRKGLYTNEPVITVFDRAPLTYNDPHLTSRIQEVFTVRFGMTCVPQEMIWAARPLSLLSRNAPYVHWLYGWFVGESAFDEKNNPITCSPFFEPLVEQTLEVGTEAMALAVLSILAV